MVVGKKDKRELGEGGEREQGRGVHTICQAGPIIMKINLFSIG